MNTPRDLSGTLESIDYAVACEDGSVRAKLERAEREPDNPHQYGLYEVPSRLARGLLQRYARGDTLDTLRQYFYDDYIPTRDRARALSATFFPDHHLAMHFEQTASWMLLCALVCFDDDGSQIGRLDDWFTPDCTPVLYTMIRKALEPGYVYPTRFAKSGAIPHEEQLVSALLQPAASWPHAFGAYMKQWPKLMKAYGYREHVEPDRHRFEFFPLHLALAVCVFDVDDSAFRHLPYYPHDLVDYYRTQVRHKRGGTIDPAIGLPDAARPQSKKTYALSKAEAYARWLELVCNEQPDLIAQASKALGKRKTMPALDATIAALASAGLGLHADLKDDATLGAQAQALCQSWQLPTPPMQADGPHGLDGVTAILNALDESDTQGGQRLAMFDDGGDNWSGLFYSCHHEAEFALLCEQLGLVRLVRAEWQ